MPEFSFKVNRLPTKKKNIVNVSGLGRGLEVFCNEQRISAISITAAAKTIVGNLEEAFLRAEFRVLFLRRFLLILESAH